MNKMSLLACALIVSGCATTNTGLNPHHLRMADKVESEITASLFESDTGQLSNEAASAILDGKISLPKHARVALLKLENESIGLKYYGHFYWRSEEYVDLQQRYVDTISSRLGNSDAVSQVIVLPSFISSEKLTLPQMREAAVRTQSHLLVIYKIQSDVFDNYRMFQANQVKAFSSCELAVLDARTGIIPYTKVISRKHMADQEGSEENLGETRRRAEIEASELCLGDLTDNLASYLGSIQ